MGPVLGKTLWAGFGGPCANKNNGDIIAQYDKLQNVWVMTQFAVAGGPPYYQCLAVSTSSDATGTYHRYAFRLPDFFPDYPKLGVWPDGYYMTWNLLNQTNKFVFVAPLVCAFDRNSIIAGTAATMQCFQLSSAYSSLLPSDLDGSTQPPAGSPDYLIDLDVNSLDLWQFHVDFARPANSAISGPVSLAVAPFTEACGGNVCIPQSGTTQHLDSLGDRLMYRFAYRNFGDHESLVVSHAVGKPSAIRWYELRDPGGSPFIYQQGTFAPDLNWRWMPSVAMDNVGDLALGFSMSSPKMHPSIRYAGRQPGDALGTLSNGNNVMSGPASQQGSNRWGDYSSMAVDPVDDCTFWYTNEYVPTLGDFNWHTRIAAFKFAGCN
jgi:hypothetical protein